jgi:CRP-like cAMP-binding protein
MANGGDVLFRQGTFPNGVYWLISGKIKIYQETPTGQKQTMYIYSDGDLIAYRQFIADEPHPVTAVLIEDTTYRFVPAEMFRGLLTSSPFFSRNILTALAREFTVWMNRMSLFSQYPVRYRLILALLILQEQYRMSGSEPGVITITRTDLAEFVGAKLETVVRALNKLKSENLVSINGRKILLPDLDGLLDVLQSEVV